LSVSSRRRFLFWTASLAASAAIPKAFAQPCSHEKESYQQQTSNANRSHSTKETLAYEINETGRFILDRCDGQTSVAEIAEDLVRVYDVPASQALEEVTEYIALLKHAKLVV